MLSIIYAGVIECNIFRSLVYILWEFNLIDFHKHIFHYISPIGIVRIHVGLRGLNDNGIHPLAIQRFVMETHHV